MMLYERKPLSVSPVQEPTPLIDANGRRIHHLRLSVISACNLRCIYCKPKTEGSHSRRLTDGNRTDFVRLLYERYGLSQVRVTGGEPLLYPQLLELIVALRRIAPDLRLAMTTNAQNLAVMAAPLREAGLDRLNVSMDSLNPERYRALTGGELRPVMEGVDAAIAAGFPPPKLNSVVLRGENDDEMPDLAAWAFDRGCEIRFLEAMPIGPAAEANRRLFVSADDIQARLATEFDLKPMGMEDGATALRFWCNGPRGSGVVGLIAPMTKPFCGSCGRVRLTADGKLYPCLLDERFADLRPAWTSCGFDPGLADSLIRGVVREKKAQGAQRQQTAMVALGG